MRTAGPKWRPHGIGVNFITPGQTVTAINREGLADPREYPACPEQNAMQRHGQPDDIADNAVFLASPAADDVNGQTIVTDDGWVLK
jgi:NAD(P)-dependent dehydrogenase (short-subunit alcohol dehydrogenase family)